MKKIFDMQTGSISRTLIILAIVILLAIIFLIGLAFLEKAVLNYHDRHSHHEPHDDKTILNGEGSHDIMKK